MKFLLLNETL